MSGFERMIARIAPRWAVRRELARRQLEMIRKAHKRTFQAVSGGRMRQDIGSTSDSADKAISGDLAALRQHVRYGEYQSGIYAGPIRRIVNNVVGRGIILRAMVVASDDLDPRIRGPKITATEAERYNTLAERHFKKWGKEADQRLRHSWYDIQRLAQGALIRDGEVLVIGRTSARRGRQVPYCLEILEADRLQTPTKEIANPSIRNGVEYDNEGVPKTYYVLKTHPGEDVFAAIRRDDFEEIPAYFENGALKVVHLFDPVRPEQGRGYSQFAAGLMDIQDLDRYQEAEKYAAIMAASYVATIETENPTTFGASFGQSAGTDTGADDGDYTRREFDFAPGATFVGRPGEKLSFNQPARPSAAFGEYSYDLLAGPANALDIPPEVLAQKWAGLNYSNARTILLQFYMSCWLRQDFIIRRLCEPVYAAWTASAVAAGVLPGQYYGRRTDELLAAKWVPVVYRRWVDPAKEATGRETDLRTNVETLTDTVTELGRDPDEHLILRARELRKMKDLEAQYGITFPGLGNAPAAARNEENEDEDETRGRQGPAVLSVARPR